MLNTRPSVSLVLGFVLAVVAIGSLIYSGRSLLFAAKADSAEDTVSKAEALNSKKDYEASLELLLGAVNEQPDNGVLKSLLKKTFVLHLQAQIAEGYDRVAANKHDIEAYLSLAKAFGLIDDHFRSMEILTTGTIENPNSAKLWLAIGLLELEQKRDAEAFSVFKEVIRLDANSASAHNDLAFVESRTSNAHIINITDALNHAKKAVSLEPNNPNYIDTLAEIEYLRGYRAEAIKLINQAISYDPEEPFYHSQLKRFQNGDQASMAKTASDLAK